MDLAGLLLGTDPAAQLLLARFLLMELVMVGAWLAISPRITRRLVRQDAGAVYDEVLAPRFGRRLELLEEKLGDRLHSAVADVQSHGERVLERAVADVREHVDARLAQLPAPAVDLDGAVAQLREHVDAAFTAFKAELEAEAQAQAAQLAQAQAAADAQEQRERMSELGSKSAEARQAKRESRAVREAQILAWLNGQGLDNVAAYVRQTAPELWSVALDAADPSSILGPLIQAEMQKRGTAQVLERPGRSGDARGGLPW